MKRLIMLVVLVLVIATSLALTAPAAFAAPVCPPDENGTPQRPYVVGFIGFPPPYYICVPIGPPSGA